MLPKPNTKRYITKMKARKGQHKQASWKHILSSWVGACIGISCIAWLSISAGVPMLMAPFGATCVLLFGVPDSPLAQPRNIVGGHLIASVLSLFLLECFGNDWYIMAIGVATAIALMQLTHTVHPPAGADPLVILMAKAKWTFLFTPVLSGSIILVVLGVLVNNSWRSRKYPKYWL